MGGTKCNFKKKKAAVSIGGYKYVGKGNEGVMKTYIGTKGPLSICLYAEWGGYRGGIMTNCPSNKGTDHCVQLVGYGSKNSQKYWKVRNQWGKGWGENGFIRLAYGSNQCNMNSNPTMTTGGKVPISSPRRRRARRRGVVPRRR